MADFKLVKFDNCNIKNDKNYLQLEFLNNNKTPSVVHILNNTGKPLDSENIKFFIKKYNELISIFSEDNNLDIS